MSKAIAIAQREIQERSLVFVVAAVVAAEPFLALFFPSSNLGDRLTAVKILGVLSGVAYVLGLSVLLGASMVGRDAREKRLSFYFARPVSGSTIWFGKMIAALFLLVGVAAILFIAPLLMVRESGWHGVFSLSIGRLIGGVLIVSFALVLFVHAGATMLRSRSALIVVDFVAALAFVGAVQYLLVPLVLHQAVKLFVAVLLAEFGAVVLVLLFAGAWQLSHGRIDPRRNHRHLSAFIWTGLAVTVVALAALTSWIGSVGPKDLEAAYLQQVDDGRNVIAIGRAKHRLDYEAAFLTENAGRRTLRVSPFIQGQSAASGDGRTVMWLEPDALAILDGGYSLGLGGRSGRFKLMATRPGDRPRAIDTGIEVLGYPWGMALTADGSRVAIYAGQMLTVYDVARARSIGTARIPASGSWDARLQFVGTDEVRVYSAMNRGTIRLVAWSFALKQHSLKQLLDYTTPARWCQYVPTADGTRLLARINRPAAGGGTLLSFEVFDLRTGQKMAEVASPEWSWMFADGRIATLEKRGAKVVMQLHSASGGVIREVELAPSSARERIVGEIDSGVLAVATSGREYSSGRGWKLSRVDLNNGAVSLIATDLAPVPKSPFGIGTTPATPTTVQPMIDANSELVAVDLRTGAQKKVM